MLILCYEKSNIQLDLYEKHYPASKVQRNLIILIVTVTLVLWNVYVLGKYVV